MVDGFLTSVEVSFEERFAIYRTLAAILHLGNVIIEETVSEGKIEISNQSIDHLENCARLLDLDILTLKQAFLTRTIEVNGDPIQ